MNNSRLNLMKYLCIVLTICLLPTAQALAADITVDADCSLANAFRSANGEAPVEPQTDCKAGDTLPDSQDTISIDFAGTDEGNILLGATLPVSSAIVINGNGYSLSGGGNQIFNVTAGSLTLNDLTLSGGFSVANGGAIAVSNAALTLYNSVVSNSGARGFGGGVYALDSDVTLADSAVTGNVTNANAEDFEPVAAADDDAEQAEGTAQAADGATELVDLEAQTEDVVMETEAQAESDEELVLPDVDGMSGAGIYFNGASNSLVIERSGIDNNSTPESGGGLYIAAGSATIHNSTISDNSASGDGGGIYNAGASIVKHATITGNSANVGGGILDAAQLQLYNSILSDNSGGDCEGALNANLANIIKDGSCNHDGATADPGLLLLSGLPAYYTLQEGSPAIDAANAEYCLAVDQRGLARLPESCDIGAAEYEQGVFNFQIQSAMALLTSTDEGGGGGEGVAEDNEAADPSPSQEESNCVLLPGHIVVKGHDNGSNVNCTHLDYVGLGDRTLVNHGAMQAVDIFGWIADPLTVCFEHDDGGIVLLDAANSPRNIVPLRTWTEADQRCASVDRVGSVVLMPRAFFVSGAIPEPIWPLADCQITTTDILNLREKPSTESSILAKVLNDVQLTADQRATYWIRVNYYGIDGWLSQDYLTTSGDCG